MKKPSIALWMYRNDGGSEIQKKLKRALEEKNVCVINDFDMRECYCQNGHVLTKDGYNLSTVDLLYHMNADEQTPYQNEILHALELSGVSIINDWDSFSTAKDKFLTNLLLRQNGVTVPDSMFLGLDQAKEMALSIFEKLGSVCVKARKNHGGRGIMLFSNPYEFKDFLECTCFESYYLEKYIEPGPHDYRVEIFDNQVIGGYCRSRTVSFKTNLLCGGLLNNPKEPDIECQNVALKAAQILKIKTTMVDMVRSVHDNKVYVLEVNPMMAIFIESMVKHSTNKDKTRVKELYSVYSYDDKKLKILADYLSSKVSAKKT
jgi:ribosomal protein S6--L-glutamate ligase